MYTRTTLDGIRRMYLHKHTYVAIVIKEEEVMNLRRACERSSSEEVWEENAALMYIFLKQQ